MRYGATLRTRPSTRALLVAAVVLLVAWEIAAQVVAAHASKPESVLPTLGQVLHSFRGLSNYWGGGLGVRAPSEGGKETLAGAFLALFSNGLKTALRLLVGLGLAFTVGVGGGLAIGFFRSVRQFASGPLIVLAQIPTFAILPLFAFWFGATPEAVVYFVVFGAGILMARMTINAVENVPSVYVQSARTLGASRLRVYRTIILPAVLPELRGAVALALTVSWTLTLGGELLGVAGGLGHMLSNAAQFAQLGQMVFIAALTVLLAGTSVVAYTRFSARLTAWAD